MDQLDFEHFKNSIVQSHKYLDNLIDSLTEGKKMDQKRWGGFDATQMWPYLVETPYHYSCFKKDKSLL